MALKLHTCSLTFLKGPHPCARVQRALDDAGVEYELVKHPVVRSKRSALIEKTGQKLLPVLELEDGTTIREESAQLVARVREGKLGDQQAG